MHHTTRARSFACSAYAAWTIGLIAGIAGASGCSLARVDTVVAIPVQPTPPPSPPPLFKIEKITRYEKDTVRWVFVNIDSKEAKVRLEFPDLLIAKAASACFPAAVHDNMPSLNRVNDVKTIELATPMGTDVGPGMCVLETRLGSSQALGIPQSGDKTFNYVIKLNGVQADPVIIVRDK